MITALQSATLLDEVDLPNGNKTKVTEKMLCKALEQIYEKQGHALMNLSEVRFKAVVLDHDLPKVSTS
eukprot:12922138-Prorocentrum_lima.AAC.1